MVVDHSYPGCSSSPEVGKLLKALLKAQQAYKPIARSESFGGEYGYRYSTWKDICESLYPPLLANGLVFLTRQSNSPNGWVMLGTLFHADSGEWMSSTAPIRDLSDSMGTRVDPQSYEIACTYAKKNLLVTLAGGWCEGDEQQAQAEVKQDDQQAAKYEAVRLKVEAGLEQFIANPKKTAQLFERMDALVSEGELRQEDCDCLKKKYAKKEVAIAH